MLKKIVAEQFKKPNGLLGFIASKLMDKGNIQAIDWVHSLLDIKDRQNILEIGYGSGILINKLASMNKAIKIFGIDFSHLMYLRAKKRNKKHIDSGKVTLSIGNVIDYREKDTRFDKIIAINVVYFWDDLKPYLQCVYKMLNSSGKVYLYLADPEDLQKIKFTKTSVFNKRSPQDIVNELGNLSFRNISYETARTNVARAYCVIAEK